MGQAEGSGFGRRWQLLVSLLRRISYSRRTMRALFLFLLLVSICLVVAIPTPQTDNADSSNSTSTPANSTDDAQSQSSSTSSSSSDAQPQSRGGGNTQTVLTLLAGPITGLKVGGSLFKFLGIPYAQPPTGNLRFASPVPFGISLGFAPLHGNAKDNSINATAFSHTCPQGNGGSEDCLYLNIWTTTVNPLASRPVMFWYFIWGLKLTVGFMEEVSVKAADQTLCLMVLHLRTRMLS